MNIFKLHGLQFLVPLHLHLLSDSLSYIWWGCIWPKIFLWVHNWNCSTKSVSLRRSIAASFCQPLKNTWFCHRRLALVLKCYLVSFLGYGWHWTHLFRDSLGWQVPRWKMEYSKGCNLWALWARIQTRKCHLKRNIKKQVSNFENMNLQSLKWRLPPAQSVTALNCLGPIPPAETL